VTPGAVLLVGLEFAIARRAPRFYNPRVKSRGRAHLSVITLAALLLGGLAAWGFFNYARAPKLTPELRGYALAEELGCHGCHGPRGTGGVPNPGASEGEIPAWDGGTAMMYVKNEEEIREWILDGRPWRLVLADSLEARAREKEREAAHRAALDSLTMLESTDSVAARALRDRLARREVDADELLQRGLPREGAAPRPPLRMPAYGDVVDEEQLADLVAYYRAVADFGEMPEAARAGYRAARELGCFGCHGPGGLVGTKNPRSFKGYIPPWRGTDYRELVRDEAELKAWILDGSIPRLEANRGAKFFTRRQVVKMPAYRGVVADSTLSAVMGYVRWVARE
jgi:mono/diheme cytochrome c family protein